MALLSVFGLILGIGVGICIKPCVDRHNMRIKKSSGAIAGDRGLEAWSSSANRSVVLVVISLRFVGRFIARVVQSVPSTSCGSLTL